MPAAPSPPQALLDSTEQLVYRDGVHATGMDAIVKRSGISRKTIYQQYPNKQALVEAALERRHERWMGWFIAASAEGRNAAERLTAAFAALGQWFASPDFHGCAFLNTAGEIADPANGLRTLARRHKQDLQDHLHALLQADGHRDAALLARQIAMLVNGAIADALVFGTAGAADAARDAALALLPSPASLPPPQD
ncbi:TetR/AcrR family transcriptional regulator [Stenotrophomonas sp. 24(2023)]|uniref:TetR/AcrR family transcriptional regulator n=1 Tax=Stenotrophomonas sp. 24(2023) TaxID=3068324 RepID=UPI0027E03592|nr:TetR/AcrR family transcriptional regulator [Stenotrophomonas sp. 24(2023)]WMJ68720.1 TetR/AcrR family transcriptional regulator [Stenotrophomonas sp. 24(2023)]